MRDGGAGLALLASLLWVSAQGQQRGEPGSRLGPQAAGGCGTKPHAWPRQGRCAHTAFTPGRGSDTWVSRAAPGKVAGQAGEGWGRTPDGIGPLLGASGSESPGLPWRPGGPSREPRGPGCRSGPRRAGGRGMNGKGVRGARLPSGGRKPVVRDPAKSRGGGGGEGPRATHGGWARGKRTGRCRLGDPPRAPTSHAGCRPRGGRTGCSAPRVDRGHLEVRERGLGCLATSRGRVGQEQRSAANFQSVCHCPGGREALLPFLRTLVPRFPQRLILQGAACWLGGHEYFLKTSMHATRDPRHTPKDTRVIQNSGRNRSKVGRRSAQHPRGKDACLASCPAVLPAARGLSLSRAHSRGTRWTGAGDRALNGCASSPRAAGQGCREFA